MSILKNLYEDSQDIYFHFGKKCMHAKSLQSCLTLRDPMGGSLTDFSVHGILQARILEWFVMPSSKRIFPTQGSNRYLLCLLHWQMGSLPLVPLGGPLVRHLYSILFI